MEKNSLRTKILNKRKSLEPYFISNASTGIYSNLKTIASFLSADSYAFYSSISNEPDMLDLMKEIQEQGKSIYLPSYSEEMSDYQLRPVRDVASDLVSGKYNVLEPHPNLPVLLDYKMKIDVWIVPGVVFSRTGWRIGFGKGYYDRLLSGCSGIKIGVCYDFQLLESIPHAPHDQQMDYCVTPNRILKVMAH